MANRHEAESSLFIQRATEAVAERQVALAHAVGEFQAEGAQLGEIAARLVATLANNGKVLVAGNGGSAAEAQHFAAELVGRFKRERDPYAALALTADTATLTAIANDYGYDQVFARQVRAFGQPGDIFVAFSSSGESENLVRAAQVAHDLGLTVVAVTCDRPNRLASLASLALRIPSVDTPVTQELHMVVTHVLCDIVESELAGVYADTMVAR